MYLSTLISPISAWSTTKGTCRPLLYQLRLDSQKMMHHQPSVYIFGNLCLVNAELRFELARVSALAHDKLKPNVF